MISSSTPGSLPATHTGAGKARGVDSQRVEISGDGPSTIALGHSGGHGANTASWSRRTARSDRQSPPAAKHTARSPTTAASGYRRWPSCCCRQARRSAQGGRPALAVASHRHNRRCCHRWWWCLSRADLELWTAGVVRWKMTQCLRECRGDGGLLSWSAGRRLSWACCWLGRGWSGLKAVQGQWDRGWRGTRFVAAHSPWLGEATMLVARQTSAEPPAWT
jgi:hypothetical protein